MRTFFHVLWLGFPALFFLLWLWAKLESIGKPKQDRPGDLLRQGWFLLICAVASILIDLYLMDSIYAATSPAWIPIGFYQLLLFPLVLLVAARIIGPSKDIKISKAPKPTQRGKH